MSKSRCVLLRVQPDIDGLIKRALRERGHASVSSYLRNLIIEERRKAGDPRVARVNANVKVGRPRAA